MNERDLLQAGYRFALSLCHNQHQAEDLIQDAWLRLIQKKGYVSNKSLLFKTTHNLFIDQYRKEKLVLLIPLDYTIDQLPAELPVSSMLTSEMEELLAELQTQEREVLFLHYYESLSVREICNILDRPRGSVLSLLHRSREKLARLISENGGLVYEQ